MATRRNQSSSNTQKSGGNTNSKPMGNGTPSPYNTNYYYQDQYYYQGQGQAQRGYRSASTQMPQGNVQYTAPQQSNARQQGQQNQQVQYPYYYNPQQYQENLYANTLSKKKSRLPIYLISGGVVVVALFAFFILRKATNMPNPIQAFATETPVIASTSEPAITATAIPTSTPIITPVPSKEVFAKNTFIDGMDVSGLTFDEGKSKIEQNANNLRYNFNIAVNFQGSTVFIINSNTVGFLMNSDYALNRAWSENRTRNYESSSSEKSEYTSEKSTLNFSQIDTMLEQVKKHAYIEPKDASVTGFNPDSEPVFTFQKEVYGRSIDTSVARERIVQMVNAFESGTVELEATTIAPKVLMADLQSKYKLLNRSRTSISKDSPEQRTDNIRVAFSKYNGMTLKPGKRFSFNKVVGERTLDRGFFEAIEYAYGELEYGVGGGVCQASTTTYLAALKSGLKIRKRVQHSLPVNYTDMGLDATVYLTKDREIDFIFENNTGHDIFISAKVIKDPSNRKRYMAEVAIYGYSKDNVRYETVTEQVEIIPAPLNPVIIKDKNAEYVIYTDQEHVVQKAREGYVIDTYLLKYEGDTLVSREKISRDTYKARPQRVYVGVTPRY